MTIQDFKKNIMAKKITEKQLEELEYIKEWCHAIIIFMTKIGGESPIFTQYVEVINDSYQKQNLKGLRYCLKDVNEWAKGLSKKDVEELNIVLENKFGINLSDANNKALKKISTIVKRGKINNEDEYRLLTSRVDEIYANDQKKAELESLNKLLAEYEK